MITGSQKATQYALVGAFRVGASRVGYVSSRVFINIGGGFFPDAPRTDPYQGGVLYDTINISDQLDERRNTCTFSLWQTPTTIGTPIIISIGSKAQTARRLFAGYVLQQEQTYQGKPRNIVYHVSCVDWSWRLDQRYVSSRYAGASASAIAENLVALWAPEFLNLGTIQPGLPLIDEITFTNEPLSTCLTRLAKRIGGYWYVDYEKRVHFFATADPLGGSAPLAITPTHPTFSRIRKRDDLSQMVTRVVLEGGGANALTALPPGATSIPVETAAWYETAGGYVVSGPQRIAYTGIQGTGDTGSLVGPGVTPVAPPTVAVVTGAGMESGVHQYAYTWVTAGGETKPSPLVAITVAPSAAPSAAPTVADLPLYPGSLTPGATYRYVYTYSEGVAYADRHVGETLPSPVSGAVVPTVGSVYVQGPLSPNPAQVRIVLYRTAANSAGPYRFVMSGSPGAAGFDWTDAYPDSALGETAPTVAAGGGNRVALSGISVGPGTVTARRIYRTAAGAAQLKLQQTIADNVSSVGVTDATPDASLGANAPTTDTSALSQPSGSVLPGATAIIVASAAWASAGGGWAIIGNGAQVILYTGISGNSITGIPVTGTGSITAAIGYNSTITAAPALVGIPAAGAGAILYPIKQGDPVNLWIIVEDAAAIALLASYTGDSGIQEEYLQDRRLSATECRARARALLALRNTPDVAVDYTVRDVTTRAGATITIALPAPTNINATLKIQQVTIHGLSHLPNHYPTFDAQASSARYTFEDLLRQANALTP